MINRNLGNILGKLVSEHTKLNSKNKNVKLNKHFMIDELITKIQKSKSNFLSIFK